MPAAETLDSPASCSRAGRRRRPCVSTAKSSSSVPTCSPFGLGDHRVGEGVGDGAAVHQRREPRALPRPEHADSPGRGAGGPASGRARSPLPRRASGSTCAYASQRQVPVGPGALHQSEQRSLVPGVHRTRGDDLLGEHVERRLGHPHRVQLALVHRPEQRRALDQLVAGEREEDALATPRAASGRRGRRAGGTGRCRAGCPSCTTRSTAPMSMPSSSDAVATIARSSPAFSLSSAARRSSRAMLPWWAATVPGPSRVSEVVRHALGELAGVGEDERRAVLGRELHQAVVDLPPHLVGGDGAAARPPASRRVSCHGRRWPTCTTRARRRARAGEERGEALERLLRGGQADELRARAAVSAFSRSSESARWLPRLSRASAWISSTMTVSHRAGASRGPAPR